MTALLDLFCGAGGAAAGYHRAGFDYIFGVDHAWQKNYPFDFIQADALEILEMLVRSGNIERFDLIHASPPCQRFSEATPMEHRRKHPDLITPTREMLRATGVPYVIENVENARDQLREPVKLCGTMLGLPLWRHRYFEIRPNRLMLTPPCKHRHGFVNAKINGKKRKVQIPVLCTGGGDGRREKRKTHRPRQPVAEIRWGMDIDWMTQQELSQAIPPAYTEYIGSRLLKLTEANDD